MRLVLKDEKYTFTVTKAAEPKTEFGSGKQKMNRASQLPEWVVEVLAMDSERGEVIRVTVTGDQPKVSQGQQVRFEDMEAIPWANNGRNGVAYRAASIQPAAQTPAPAWPVAIGDGPVIRSPPRALRTERITLP